MTSIFSFNVRHFLLPLASVDDVEEIFALCRDPEGDLVTFARGFGLEPWSSLSDP